MYVRYETDKNSPISNLDPHYTNPRFRDAQTVYLARGHVTVLCYGTQVVKGAVYEYSDRLFGWHSDDHDAAWEEAAKSYPERRSAAFLEQ